LSPALQGKTLKRIFPLMEIQECHLKETHRTDQFSSILKNATHIRNLKSVNHPLIHFIDESTLVIKGYEVHEKIENSYAHVGVENTIVLTLSNKQANQWNSGIRKTLFFREEIIEKGETLLVIKNNYFWINPASPMGFLANGELICVERIIKYERMYNRDFAKIEVYFPSYPDLENKEIIVLLETLTIETASLGREKMKELFFEIEEDYSHISNKQVRYREILNNPYFNAVHVKYGYASTVHKAQGGQWSHVFIDGSFIPDAMNDKSYLRWLYTAVTRSKEKLFLVNFSDLFFSTKSD
ncbi:MAG: ATP-binding domain-containing protein, partial [Crocinitomicaceae bacterium]|nr:ATP-binding domain-containing protein [Crocinitomicaceae bacterium]